MLVWGEGGQIFEAPEFKGSYRIVRKVGGSSGSTWWFAIG